MKEGYEIGTPTSFCTALKTAVLSPENEKSSSSTFGCGNLYLLGSPSSAALLILGPPGYGKPSIFATLSKQQVADFAASFQKTAVDILCEKLKLALSKYPETQSVVVAGGVSANKTLREALPEAFFPAPSLSGDNGAMVAAAAYYEIQSGVQSTDPYKLNIYPRIEIDR